MGLTRVIPPGTYVDPPVDTEIRMFVGSGANASDANSGLHTGRPKATIAAAYASLPSTGGTIVIGAGTFVLPSGAVGLNITPGKVCNLIGAGRQHTTMTYAGTGIGIHVGDGRSVSDAVTNSTTTLTSSTAAFVAGDVGKVVYGGSVPADATIASVTNSTTVILSAAATATASGVTVTIATGHQDWGSLRRFMLICSAFTTQTGIKMTSAHRGIIEGVHARGNSYSAGSRGMWNINGFTHKITDCVIDNFDTGIDLDGGCHDTSVNDTNIGAQTAEIRVKDSTDFKARGGQHSGTGASVGHMVISTTPIAGGGCDNYRIEALHFEGNGIGKDVVFGRAADGSTAGIRLPVINSATPKGATFDQCLSPTIINPNLTFDGLLSITANCTDARIVGIIPARGTITDLGVRTIRDADFSRVSSAHQAHLDLIANPASTSQGTWVSGNFDAGAFGGGYTTNTSGAVNDRAVYSMHLPAGTYALDVYGMKASDCGDVTIALAGVALASNFLGFAASPVATFQTLQSVVVAVSGSTSVAFQVTTKNGGSSAYKCRISRVTLRRTA